MFIVLKREWEVLDGAARGKKVNIPPGRHEVERIPNPFGYPGTWLVLKGTIIGQGEKAWRQWQNDGQPIDNPGHPNHGKVILWGDDEVVIEEATRRGFGPADLVSRLRSAPWVPCSPQGRNFEGMVLGEYCLTDTPDELCSVRFLVTVRNARTHETVIINGYCFPDLIMLLTRGHGKTSFLGKALQKRFSRGRRTHYEVVVSHA